MITNARQYNITIAFTEVPSQKNRAMWNQFMHVEQTMDADFDPQQPVSF